MTAILETMTVASQPLRVAGALSVDDLVDAASDAYAGLRRDGMRVLEDIQETLAIARWMDVPAGDVRLVRLGWAWEALFAKLTTS